MAGVTERIEKWNAREVLASSDLMRAQYLAAKARQDLEASRARSFDSDVPNPGGPADLLQFNGTPISGIEEAPTLTGASGFSVTIGAGSGLLWYPGYSTLTADDSGYLQVRWPVGTVTHTNPDGTNPRIDVIVATAAMVDTDLQSRNILVDPVARTITPQNVFKTSAPTATLSVIAGTPSGNPVVPAIPVGALALFYVWVPPGAGSAASFAQARASWRRVEYPFAAMSGVVSGLGLKWDLAANPASASSTMSVSGLHRVLIDGELHEFYGVLDSVNGGVVQDTAANPFTVAAPAQWNKIYYVYAVGGRHNRLPSLNSTSGILSPITIVESLTPPNLSTGKPTANMTVNGQTVAPAGAVYIGFGMVVANTTRRAGLIMEDDVTYFGSAVAGGNSIFVVRTGAAADPFSTPPSAAQIGFPTTASVSLSAALVGSTPGYYNVHPDTTAGGISPQFSSGYGPMELVASIPAVAVGGLTNGRLPWPAPGQGALWLKGGTTGDTVNISVKGYAHRVRMIGMTTLT